MNHICTKIYTNINLTIHQNNLTYIHSHTHTHTLTHPHTQTPSQGSVEQLGQQLKAAGFATRVLAPAPAGTPLTVGV